MATSSELFPTDLSWGTVVGYEFLTRVLRNPSGAEVRSNKRATARLVADVSQSVKSWEDLNTLRSFYEARQGRTESFSFENPFEYSTAADGISDPTNLDQVLERVGSGVYQMGRNVALSSGTLLRPIKRVQSGTTVLAVDGVNETNFVMDETTGRATITPDPGGSAVVTGGCKYYFVMRFDFSDDTLALSADAFDSGSVPSMPMAEDLDNVVIPAMLFAGGVVTEALGDADRTLDASEARTYIFTANSDDVDLLLPTPTGYPTGRYFTIINEGTQDIVLRNESGTLLSTIAQNDQVTVLLVTSSSTETWVSVAI